MIELKIASSKQLPLFHAMEQDADTSPYILPTTLEQHQQAFDHDDIIYLSIYENGEVAGYFILALDADGSSVELRRIVVARKGRGTGSSAIGALETFCRDRLKRKRIWLDVFDFNARGRQVYTRLGYRPFDQQDFEGKQLLFYEKNICPE